MILIHNEGIPVVAERFMRTLKTKICKYMISISKNMYTIEQLKLIHKITRWNCTLVKKLMIKILNLKLVIM